MEPEHKLFEECRNGYHPQCSKWYNNGSPAVIYHFDQGQNIHWADSPEIPGWRMENTHRGLLEDMVRAFTQFHYGGAICNCDCHIRV